MKKSKFSPTQMAQILKEYDGGKTAEEIIREHGISKATLYKWRQHYGGMEASELKRIKELEDENARLMRMYANLAMELDTAKYILEKNFKALRKEAHSRTDKKRRFPGHLQDVQDITGKQKQLFQLSLIQCFEFFNLRSNHITAIFRPRI